jgi:hypothetical protein
MEETNKSTALAEGDDTDEEEKSEDIPVEVVPVYQGTENHLSVDLDDPEDPPEQENGATYTDESKEGIAMKWKCI